MHSTPLPPQRRQLAGELKRLRGSRTLAEVTHLLGWSESKLSRIENGKLNISREDLEQLVAVYATNEQVKARLSDLRARKNEWWLPYTEALTDPYEVYIAQEARATAIRSYEAQIVPGLLQTAEYAQAVMQADSTLQDPDTIHQRVQVRMARQAVLTREPRPTFHVVIDEAVLARPIGGPAVFEQQLLSLAGAARRPNVTLQVLTFAVGAHRALAGSFTLLEFSDGNAPVVYSEGLTGGVVRTERDEVGSYRESFEAICAVALSPDASVTLINSTARAFVTNREEA